MSRRICPGREDDWDSLPLYGPFLLTAAAETDVDRSVSGSFPLRFSHRRRRKPQMPPRHGWELVRRSILSNKSVALPRDGARKGMKIGLLPTGGGLRARNPSTSISHRSMWTFEGASRFQTRMRRARLAWRDKQSFGTASRFRRLRNPREPKPRRCKPACRHRVSHRPAGRAPCRGPQSASCGRLVSASSCSAASTTH